MIHAGKIPFSARTFVNNCTDDVLNGRYSLTPDGYLDYLVKETEKRDERLVSVLRVLDRRSGEPRFSADADHIVPRSIWGFLMFGFIEPGKCGTSFNVLSNLFWRDRQFNRSNDMAAIKIVQREVKTMSGRMNSPEGLAWRKKWIEIFLRTKYDEGISFPAELVDHRTLHNIPMPE